jgi:hypothetical protein
MLEWELIAEQPTGWNFSSISEYNSRITPEIVSTWANQLDFQRLSLNPAVTSRIFRLNQNRNWNLNSLFYSTQDPELVRILITEFSLLNGFGLGQKFIQKHFLRHFSQDSDYKVLAEIRVLFQLTRKNLRLTQNSKANRLSQDPSLDWRKVARNPELYNFSLLSKNKYNRNPGRIWEFQQICKRFLVKLIRALRNSDRRREFQLLIFPIRLRFEDILIRGCPNESPRFIGLY